ncbi:hypothetical protein SASPL_115444 [Salvia splendens]|uniref:Uncharacterized protein n=1 Tax=Salvia splendens TaxID=180675 RepID=A0A8X9A252_SALSN|nr:hypothetical protein SASPL_115444 [Salvia splendens]
MTSICPPTFPSPRTNPKPLKFNFVHSRFISSKFRRRLQSGVSLSRVPDSSFCCRCNQRGSGGGDSSDSGAKEVWRWGFGVQETFRNAIKRFDDYLSSLRDQRTGETLVMAEKWGDEEEEGEKWDWERWMNHFLEVDEQERVVSILKSQLANAIEREDYEEAARIKVAIAPLLGATLLAGDLWRKSDMEMQLLYVIMQGLVWWVGWWAGTSEDANDPYGRIIHMSAEHGRYIARSYSPRLLDIEVRENWPSLEFKILDGLMVNFISKEVLLLALFTGAPEPHLVSPIFCNSKDNCAVCSDELFRSPIEIWGREIPVPGI